MANINGRQSIRRKLEGTPGAITIPGVQLQDLSASSAARSSKRGSRLSSSKPTPSRQPPSSSLGFTGGPQRDSSVSTGGLPTRSKDERQKLGLTFIDPRSAIASQAKSSLSSLNRLPESSLGRSHSERLLKDQAAVTLPAASLEGAPVGPSRESEVTRQHGASALGVFAAASRSDTSLARVWNTGNHPHEREGSSPLHTLSNSSQIRIDVQRETQTFVDEVCPIVERRDDASHLQLAPMREVDRSNVQNLSGSPSSIALLSDTSKPETPFSESSRLNPSARATGSAYSEDTSSYPPSEQEEGPITSERAPSVASSIVSRPTFGRRSTSWAPSVAVANSIWTDETTGPRMLGDSHGLPGQHDTRSLQGHGSIVVEGVTFLPVNIGTPQTPR